MENMNSTSGLMSFALLLVGLGGAIGSMARFAIGNWLGPWLAPGNFNLSTTAVNVVGSFLLGCLAANFPDRSKSYSNDWDRILIRSSFNFRKYHVIWNA